MLQTGAGDGVNAVLAFSQAEACVQSKASKEFYKNVVPALPVPEITT